MGVKVVEATGDWNLIGSDPVHAIEKFNGSSTYDEKYYYYLKEGSSLKYKYITDSLNSYETNGTTQKVYTLRPDAEYKIVLTNISMGYYEKNGGWPNIFVNNDIYRGIDYHNKPKPLDISYIINSNTTQFDILACNVISCGDPEGTYKGTGYISLYERILNASPTLTLTSPTSNSPF